MSKALGASPFTAGAVVARKYRLREVLGEGTTGVVWLAADVTTDSDVALKLVVHPEPEARIHILRDAQACCGLIHENVCRVLDVGETGSGDPFLVMERLSGETLAHLLARGRRLGQREVAAIGRDVARALAAAHERGIVHRNLKPANVFLHDATWEIVPVVKVLDFALGDDVVASSASASASADGAAGVVSAMYTSPEQLLGDEAIDGRSDVWSLGVVLHEMLTGAPLFEGPTEEVVRRMWTQDVPPLHWKLRTLDGGLSRLIMACLQRTRARRPWPMSEVADALEELSGPPERAARSVLSRLASSRPPAPMPLPATPAAAATPTSAAPPAQDAQPVIEAARTAPAAEQTVTPAGQTVTPEAQTATLAPTRGPVARRGRTVAAPSTSARRSGAGPLLRGRRWSPAAAARAALGACVLSMIGVTVIVLAAARGCNGASGAPACGERCAQRAP